MTSGSSQKGRVRRGLLGDSRQASAHALEAGPEAALLDTDTPAGVSGRVPKVVSAARPRAC